MNKRKLVQIIVKDLEELKILSEEVAEIKGDASLFIDLALSKARLLCQEIELLREFSTSLPNEEEITEEEDDDFGDAENGDVNISDPELEILNFEHPVIQEDEPETEEDEDEEVKNESDKGEFQEADEDDENPKAEESEPEFEIGKDEEEELTEEQEFSADQNDENDEQLEEEELNEEEEEEEEVIDIQPEADTQAADPKTNKNSEIREIQIDDMDDDLESIKFTPASEATDRPLMREIPKPGSQAQEKPVIGESFQKERSLNDAMGENKANESKLTNGPITSLRAAIGLNDRFLFIREIFANNTDKYNTIIDHLDKLETIQQAVDYLKVNLTLQKNETSLKFVELLKRRFSK